MSSLIIYGTKASRLTLYNPDGSKAYRVTLQKEVKEGLILSLSPEGAANQLGSASSWRRTWAHRGFRPSLAISWDVGVSSTIETWTSGAWGPATDILTAAALSKILSYGMQAPMDVQPHLDHSWTFQAQPDPGKSLDFRDVRGVAHTGLELGLIGTVVVNLPDWLQG